MQLVLRENNPLDFKFTNQAFIFLIFFFLKVPLKTSLANGLLEIFLLLLQ